MEHLQGAVALITGAATGIGRGIAEACLQAGMQVVMTDVREEVLQATVQALPVKPALALKLDVTDRQAWQACVERIERELGAGVRLLCSNAGVNFVGPTQESTFEDWEFTLGVNLGGAINAVRTVVPRMIAQKAQGHVVLTSSVSGLFANGGAGAYTTSKFALVGLGESLRADLAPHGIGVSVLCPGPVKSELFESTLTVRPAHLAASGARAVVPPGVRREDTAIFRTAPTGGEIGRQVLEGVRRNHLYILTHPEIRSILEARHQALLAALPQQTPDPERIAAEAMLLDPAVYTK